MVADLDVVWWRRLTGDPRIPVELEDEEPVSSWWANAVNPQGQFLFLEGLCNELSLTPAFADGCGGLVRGRAGHAIRQGDTEIDMTYAG
ncbi:MAG: hypothetical protein M3N25_02055 [Actinomycetota bacterium]|nr:hypothetical protein [Actinomycetota bacterium]